MHTCSPIFFKTCMFRLKIVEPPKYLLDMISLVYANNRVLDTSNHMTGIHASPRHMMQIPTSFWRLKKDSLEEMGDGEMV